MRFRKLEIKGIRETKLVVYKDKIFFLIHLWGFKLFLSSSLIGFVKAELQIVRKI